MYRKSNSQIDVETAVAGKLYASVFNKSELVVCRDINVADDDPDYRQVLERIGDAAKERSLEEEEISDDRMASGRAKRITFKLP